MKVILKHKITGEIRTLPISWSWLLFFLAGVCGLPLFLRKLVIPGVFFFALWAVASIAASFTLAYPDSNVPALILGLVMVLGFLSHIFIGINGPGLTGRQMLSDGWEFTDANQEAVKLARIKWSLLNAS